MQHFEGYPIADELGDRIKAKQDISGKSLTNGIIDYSLKCLSGPHKNKFVYINLTAEGDIIGSDPQEATLYIESDEIHPKHALVTCRSGAYFVKDLGSKIGTWHRQGVYEWIPVEDRMEVKIFDQLFVFQYGDTIKDPVYCIFEKHDVADALEEMRRLGIDPRDHLAGMSLEQLDKISKGQQKKRQNIEKAIDEIKTELVKGYVDKKLVVITKEGRKQLDWRDYIIGNSENADFYVKGPLCQNLEEGNAFDIVLTYLQGKYWIINNPVRPLRDIYIRIFPDSGEVYLRPEDCLKLGSLELQVCRFNIGRTEEKGDRQLMEDRMVVIQDLGLNSRIDVSLFAVMDGHNGFLCSKFVSEKLSMVIKNNLMFWDKKQQADIENQDNLFDFVKNVLETSCRIVDLDYLSSYDSLSSIRGTTCILTLIVGDRLFCMNVGDSRAILSRNKNAVLLSRDHKPNDPLENSRIREAQGIVEGGKVKMSDKNYELGCSRSFGDFIFKPASSGRDVKAEDVISAVPEIREIHLDFVKDDFIILGCDGLFDHLDNQEIVDFVNNRMSDMVIGSQDTQKVADELVQFALKASREKAKDNKSDNISVIIVPLTRAVLKAE